MNALLYCALEIHLWKTSGGKHEVSLRVLNRRHKLIADLGNWSASIDRRLLLTDAVYPPSMH
jgi:hypothetical protein